jgi:hypothetical protein
VSARRSTFVRAALALVLLASAGARAELPALGPPQPLDGVAAFVGGTTPGEGVLVILRSDVELRARLSLLAAGASDPAHVPLPEELLKATLDELLGEALIAIEATRLGLSAPATEEVAQARMHILPPAASELAFRGLLDALGIGAQDLDELARRSAVVGAFLAANLEGMLTPSESELKRAFESEAHPFRGESFASAHDRFAAWLSQKRLHEAVARWVLSLRERTPYRVLLSLP